MICHTVEDEFHFVCECKKYDVIRKSLLPKYYWKRPNMFEFIELIKYDSKDMINCIIIDQDISVHII